MTAMATWDTYLGVLREIHTVRQAAADHGQATADTVQARAAQLDSLTQQLLGQEARVATLARELRSPARFGDLAHARPAKPMPWDESVAELTGHLRAADQAATDAEHYGSRPQLFPDWRSDAARNGVIYAAFALPNVCVNLGLSLFYLDSTLDTGINSAIWGCCLWPVFAVVAGIATIRAVGVPRLPPKAPNAYTPAPKTHNVLLSIPLGIFIAIASAVGPVIALWLLGGLFTF